MREYANTQHMKNAVCVKKGYRHTVGHKSVRQKYLSLRSLLESPSCLVCSPRFLLATGRSLEPNW